MGIIAWIVLGLGAGLLANMLIPGKTSQGLIITCLIGMAGALLGGWAATKLFHIHSLDGFSTCPPGSPRSPVRPSCCSPITWSPGGPAAGSPTAEKMPGLLRLTARPGQARRPQAWISGRRMPCLSLLACDLKPRSPS
jgi:uncharacterized membrane protein YeaQ/YmgE (transglycosylase-associated protein family)